MTEPTAAPVTDEAVRAALASDDDWAAVTRPAGYQPLSEARVRNLLEAAAPTIAADLRAQLAEAGQVIRTFLAHHGNSKSASFQKALDLAEGIRQVLDRAPLERSDDEEAAHG